MCPVSGGAALAMAVVGSTTTAAGIAVAAAGAAAIGAGIGVAVNAGVNLATGRGAFDNWGRAAAFGAISGGVGSYASGTEAAFFAAEGVNPTWFEQAVGYAAGAGSGTSIALTTAAGSFLGAMTPDYSQFGYGAQPYEPQGYSSQYAQVTGSGGRQAAAVLAQEIKKSRTLRQRQQEETTAYNVAGELASTGLQIA